MAERQRSQRLFFALWPEPEMRHRIARTARQWLDREGRPVHLADLHITLVFLGSVSQDRLPCINDAASQIQGQPFELEIDRLGYWSKPKVLWFAPSLVPDALQHLVSTLQFNLKQCGFEPEARTYRPHITLARKARPREDLVLQQPLNWKVREFALIRSDTGRAPPFYDVQKKWTLDS